MNFLSTLNKMSSKDVKDKRKRLYGEADTGTEDFELPDETDLNLDEPEVPEEPVEETEPIEDMEVEDTTEEELGEDEFFMDDPTLNEDAGITDEDMEDKTGDVDTSNMFDENEDEDTPEFRRKIRKLNRAFSDLYDQYVRVVEKLESIDTTGDRAVIIDKFINRYKAALNSLSDYTYDNSDTWVIRFQTFVEFRALFISINRELGDIEKTVPILS